MYHRCLHDMLLISQSPGVSFVLDKAMGVEEDALKGSTDSRAGIMT